MANTVIALKKSATPGSVPASLQFGELGINYADGKLFYKNTNNQIAEISGASQNYFGTVNANNTLIIADTPADVVTMVPGDNITIVGDAVNDKLTIGLSNDVVVPGLLTVSAASGDEGGEIKLANAITNSVLSGKVVIDIYQNKLRFFEESGTNRGAYINLASASTGVGTDLLAAASATDTTARNWASAAFDQANTARTHANNAYNKANNALANTTGTFAGDLTVAGSLTTTSNVVSFGSAFKIEANGDVFIFGTLNMLN